MLIRLRDQPATREKTPDIKKVMIDALAIKVCAFSAAMIPFSIYSAWIGFEKTGNPLIAMPLLTTSPSVATTRISHR
jgi:hypothetical protein